MPAELSNTVITYKIEIQNMNTIVTKCERQM